MRRSWVSERQFNKIANSKVANYLVDTSSSELFDAGPLSNPQNNERVLEVDKPEEDPLLCYLNRSYDTPLVQESDESESWFTSQEFLDPEQNVEKSGYEEYETKEFLKYWAIFYRIHRDALEDLLHFLHESTHFKDLPVTMRTLLGTPTEKAPSRVIEPGQYVHFGLSNLASELAQKLNLNPTNDQISLHYECTLHYDGISFANASKLSGWTILVQIDDLKDVIEPVLLGVYSGYSPPKDFDEFLIDAVKDFNDSSMNGIITESGLKIYFHLTKIVADAPARSKGTHTKGHSSNDGCPFCPQRGSRPVGAKSVQYSSEIAFPLRNNATYLNRADPDHHHTSHLEKKGALELLDGFDCVDGLPGEQMHTGDSGVVRKMTCTILSGGNKNGTKVPQNVITQINEAYLDLSTFKPFEFSRRARDLINNQNYLKATEGRSIGIYYGIKIFKNLETPMYEHFLKYCLAIKLLSTSDVTETSISLAEKLLKEYVQNFTKFYGFQLSYVIHALLHLPHFVRLYGPLYSFSAYTFENRLGILKGDIRKKFQINEQLYNRTKERGMIQFKKAPEMGLKKITGRDKSLFLEYHCSNFKFACDSEANSFARIQKDGISIPVKIFGFTYDDEGLIRFYFTRLTVVGPYF